MKQTQLTVPVVHPQAHTGTAAAPGGIWVLPQPGSAVTTGLQIALVADFCSPTLYINFSLYLKFFECVFILPQVKFRQELPNSWET